MPERACDGRSAPQIRLLALDVDGTLLNPRGHVAPRTAAAIRAAVARGVLVILCTGRTFAHDVQRLAQELGLSLPAIVRNGSAIQDTATGAVLAYHPLPPETVRAALDRILASDTVPLVQEGPLQGEQLYTLPRQAWNDAVPYFIADWERQERHACVAEPGDLYCVAEPTWIGACGPRVSVEAVYEILCALAGVDVWTTTTLGERPHHCTGIVPAGVTKASALAEFAAQHGVSLAETMAVGDYWNDVEMLREVGWGVAMGHAPDAVKAVAKAVTLDNVHDGAAAAIERYVLGTGEHP
jgi:hydroxymethylpyrimidine pyrophosphatase-like HAD family hydrolase